MDTILSIENLAISIPVQKRNIVDGVSFDIKAGEIVVLSGANGCGKSTIIKAIMSDSDLYGLKIEGSIKFENSENIIYCTQKQLEDLKKK